MKLEWIHFDHGPERGTEPSVARTWGLGQTEDFKFILTNAFIEDIKIKQLTFKLSAELYAVFFFNLHYSTLFSLSFQFHTQQKVVQLRFP